MPARPRAVPLLVTALVALAALAAAAWLVFRAPEAGVGQEAGVELPPAAESVPMMKPEPPATAPGPR